MSNLAETTILHQTRDLALLKFTLLAQGMRINSEAKSALRHAKQPIRTRSGVSGGLDIVLDGIVHVNVPVLEKFSERSDIELTYQDGRFTLLRNRKAIMDVDVLPEPDYYKRTTRDGSEPMVHIGQMCSGDRFCYGMTGPGCFFWRKDRRCKFCSIGDNYHADAAKKKAAHLIEVLEEAIGDPKHPAKHVLIGGGTPPGEDMGAIMAADLCRAIKARCDISIYVMIAAPLENKYIDLLHESGADELGMNLEFWSDSAWSKYIPGKAKIIGKQRYLQALEHSVKVFGPINTRTIFVAGIEEPAFTVDGARSVAALGVMPIISPFRPLNGTMLESSNGFDPETYLEVFTDIQHQIERYDIPIGPTCICCQNNTLSMPFGNHYHFY